MSESLKEALDNIEAWTKGKDYMPPWSDALAAARSFLRISPDDGEWPEELVERAAQTLTTNYPISFGSQYLTSTRQVVETVLQAIYDYARDDLSVVKGLGVEDSPAREETE